MTSRRDLLVGLPAGAFLALGPAALPARADLPPPQGPLWRSASLVEATVTAPNGAITTAAAAGVDAALQMDRKQAREVAPGVWLLSGWGIANSMAIQAPEGWIVVDTGDSTRAAQDMRDMLEAAVGQKIKVAAILLTHWHYADGTAAWADSGATVWGHEWLDRNRSAGSGVGPIAGFYQTRAIAQFAVLHPAEGPDAFPNVFRFTPEKLVAVSSYAPPGRLIANLSVETFTIGGEEVEVLPNRSDSSDSIGFFFPRLRLMISNFMVPGFIFNVFSLRGGPYRNPDAFLEDARRMETRNAAVLLDVHAAPVTGEEAVRAAIRRSGDQVQLIRDQTLRLIARGLDQRQAAEAVFMPAHQREGWETYGQVESHVRQVWNGTVGWFGNDVYEINPLPVAEEARRTVLQMGGVQAVREAAAASAAEGTIPGWQWGLRLTTLLLQIDPQDASAAASRARAARALGQRTTSGNARGWYITEALEREGALTLLGQPVTLAQVRAVLGTPRPDELATAGTAASLALLRSLVDPRAAGDARASVTLQVQGDAAPIRLDLRNGVLVDTPAATSLADAMTLTPDDLARFVLGLAPPAPGSPLAALDAVLDRSGLAVLPDSVLAALATPAAEDHLLGEGGQ